MSYLDNLLKRQWNDFSTYPREGSSIIIHLSGMSVSENKMLHKFVHIESFHASEFDCSQYKPKERVRWSWGWIYDN